MSAKAASHALHSLPFHRPRQRLPCDGNAMAFKSLPAWTRQVHRSAPLFLLLDLYTHRVDANFAALYLDGSREEAQEAREYHRRRVGVAAISMIVVTFSLGQLLSPNVQLFELQAELKKLLKCA